MDGKSVDIAAQVDLDESAIRHMDAVVDRFVVGRKHEKAIKAGIAAALLVGDGLLRVHVVAGAGKADAEKPSRLRFLVLGSWFLVDVICG